MDKKAILRIVEQFRKGIEQRGIAPEKIILYGSHATGTAGPGSGIDVVIISKDFSDKGYWERIDILADVIYERFAPIEAVALPPDEWRQGESFRVDYARNGEVLFAA